MQDSEMAGACDMCGGEEKMHTGFWWGNLKEGNHLKGIGLD